MKKKILALCLFTVLAFTCAVPAAAEPYRNYTFDMENVWPEPQAYVVDDYISSDRIGVDNLVAPADLNEGVFILDGKKDGGSLFESSGHGLLLFSAPRGTYY